MAKAAITYRRLNPSERTLLGPDLSNASPRARQGLIATLQGANDPEFLAVLDHARTLLRDLWRTDNPDTFIFPGSEEAGLEAVLANLVEPGDVVAVGVIGFAGERGMEYREARHHNRHTALLAALETLGLQIRLSPEHRLPSVVVVEVPAGIDGEQIRSDLRRLYRIDVAGGVGRWAGEVWRVGILSHSAQPSYLVQFVSVLEVLLAADGHPVREPGAAVRTLIEALDP